jgi:chemotaxis protein MotB
MKPIFPLLIAATLSACAGARLEQQKKEIDDLRAQAGSMVSQLKDRADEVEALKTRVAELETGLAEAKGRAAAAEGRADTLAKSNKDLSSALSAGKEALGAKLDDAIKEKDALAQKLSEAVNEKLAVERVKSLYQAAKDKASRELSRLGKEREALLARLAGADAERKAAEEARVKAEAERSAAVARVREEMGAVADALLKELQSGAARLEQSGERFTLTLSDAALFEDGTAKLHDKGAALLDRAAAALKALPGRRLTIAAHADNAPVKKGLLGGFESSVELTAARAAAVARRLHAHGGLDPARLVAQGHGEFRPLKPNDSAAGRAANRRIELEAAPDPLTK